MSEEYDLKKSENKIGQLYPILKSKDGQIIDGFHRQKADPNWKTLVVPEIDTDEKLLLARLIANFHRRQITREEKERWINGLAKIYEDQGLKVSGEKVSSAGTAPNEIVNKIVEVTGLSGYTITSLLKEKFKHTEMSRPHASSVLASQRIETTLGSEVAERFRKQVLAEAKLSPQERGALTKKREHETEERKQKREENKRKKEEKLQKQAEERAKNLKAKELIKDPSFQREVIREIHKEEAIAEGESCPILPDDVDTPDESITPMPANPKTTITVACPKCGFKFEF